MALSCAAVVSDLDGVLVDSNAIAERHMGAWAVRHGVDIVIAHLDELTIAVGADAVEVGWRAAIREGDREVH